MSTVWIHHARPRTRWYDTDPATQNTHRMSWSEVDQRSMNAGGHRIGVFRARGQSDWATVELWTFSSPEQAFDHWTAKVDSGYAEWFAFSNSIGTHTERDGLT